MIRSHWLFLAVTLQVAGLSACNQTKSAEETTAAAPAPAKPAYQPAQVSSAALASGLYELVYSPRQQAVFVASSGGFGKDGDASKVLRLDPKTLAVQQEISLPLKGFGLVLDDAADRLYVSHTMDTAISVIDTASNSVRDTLRLAPEPAQPSHGDDTPHLRELVVDPANHRLYAPGLSFAGSVLFVVDTDSFKLEKTLPDFGPVATGIALDAAGKRLFVSNFGGEIITVDTAALAISGRFDSGVEQPINLAWDAAGKRLLATDQGLEMVRKMQAEHAPGFQSKNPGNRLAVIDPDAKTVTASLATGEGPISVLLDAPRSRLFVTNRGSGSVSVFDSGNQALLETVALPTHPNSLALDPESGAVYVTVKNGKDATGPESVAKLAY